MIAAFLQTLFGTLRDLLPIGLIFGFFMFVVLRGPLVNPGRVILGWIYVLVGMAFFLEGLEIAIFPLGEMMARQLTDPLFLLGHPVADAAELADWANYGWVYVFAFAIGLSTTLAEPALIAVGMKAQQVSGGAISAFGLRIAVSFGVAIGVALGCFRIVTGTELWVYIVVAYVMVIVQTMFAPRIIVPLAYDSGGVTTSTVTVPLLAALGLGLASNIPGRSPIIDGFGLIAFASVFPIMTVIGYAQISELLRRLRRKREAENAL
ncbi:MAG TPA: DUF1538 domain-containing protein [Mariprofundaceae bacterium]|nr:DUF1538 domain-containing protein [Mariprofundaceae bacterium]